MKAGKSIVAYSVSHPRLITAGMGALAVILALAGVLRGVKVDTDPENMLAEDQPVRVFHDEMKRLFSMYDMVVVGVVNEKDEDGVFNPTSLKNVYELTEYAKALRWSEEGTSEVTEAAPAAPSAPPGGPGSGEAPKQTRQIGVIERDVLAPSTVDNIEQAGLGQVSFNWLMSKPPETREEALKVRDSARRLPFLNGTLISEDAKALCIYLPLTSKDLSYRVYGKLLEKISTLEGEDEYHITGLPVAEDTFGVEMFKQMALSAPAAMLVIFILMFAFFRKISLILSPLILAMATVVCTMGLLVGTGHTVHIMSSMIPIFIMPIAVLDSVHILSEFFDRYRSVGTRRETILQVMEELFSPMLYTSLTSAAGFGSLALTPIPPVQVFGVFVAIGVMLAWVLTVTFIPAYVMFIREESLEGFGGPAEESKSTPAMDRLLARVGRFTSGSAKLILAATLLVSALAAYGISRIRINDNPTKWFTKSHPIRVADKVLNAHFGGTYMAYLALESEGVESVADYAGGLGERIDARALKLKEELPASQAAFAALKQSAGREASRAKSVEQLLDALADLAEKKLDAAEGEQIDAWDEALLFIDEERQRPEVFKSPELLRWVSRLQDALPATGVVGKSNSLSDVVKTVHRELFLADEKAFKIPDSRAAVSQCLITYQNSHRPHDLWHFVTPDYRKANIWVQLRSGDNRDMAAVVEHVDRFVRENPPPLPVKHRWFGLTYINVVWQEKMVSGMLQAFLGSFLIVFLMMVILFRSALWGLLCMIPLTVTIGLIYGFIGLAGKDYDMPVAVLSSLTLGLAVDFAIHFLARSRKLQGDYGSWEAAAGPVFGEPARAISRNVVVIAVGFLPLLLAPLVPYKTVGMFMAGILAVSGMGTLLILPALLRVLERRLFAPKQVMGVKCNCAACLASATAAVLLVAVNLHQYLAVRWTTLTWISIVAIPLLAFGCGLMSRREKCRLVEQAEEKSQEENENEQA